LLPLAIGIIAAMSVNDSHQGQGVGTALVDAFVEVSRRQGAPFVDYQRPTRSVQGILERAGFVATSATNWRKLF